MKNHLLRPFAVAAISLPLILAVFAFTASAQTSADGSIVGRITDTSGAAIAGVQVVARSVLVGGTFKAVSDGAGNYRLTELPPASDYAIDAESKGFEHFERVGLLVRAGRTWPHGIPRR